MRNFEYQVEKQRYLKTFWWQTLAIGCTAIALGGGAEPTKAEARPIDCQSSLPPATQKVDGKNVANFNVKTKFNNIGEVELSFSRRDDGYYIYFGHPEENLDVSATELETHNDGYIQTIVINENHVFVAQFTKAASQDAEVAASCVTEYIRQDGDYARGTIVP